MYSHYYGLIKPILGDVQVVMSDTDSLLLKIKTHKSHAQLFQDLSSIMDFSNLPNDHPMYDNSRENMTSYWKDEVV